MIPVHAAAVAFALSASSAFAQAQPGAAASSVLPSGGGQALIDTSDSALLLLDHQAGLFQTVKDISVTELRNNTIMLAKLATLLKIPVITSASEPGGPNGPLMPEIHQFAPHAQYVGAKPMTRVSRAIEKGETKGFMQVVVDAETHKILGAAILGTGGDEAIHGVLDMINAGVSYVTLQRAVPIHPTVSELIPTMLSEMRPAEVSQQTGSSRQEARERQVAQGVP